MSQRVNWQQLKAEVRLNMKEENMGMNRLVDKRQDMVEEVEI